MSSLLQFVKDNDLKSAFVMTCVGSLTKATLRMANAGDGGKNVSVSKRICASLLHYSLPPRPYLNVFHCG